MVWLSEFSRVKLVGVIHHEGPPMTKPSNPQKRGKPDVKFHGNGVSCMIKVALSASFGQTQTSSECERHNCQVPLRKDVVCTMSYFFTKNRASHIGWPALMRGRKHLLCWVVLGTLVVEIHRYEAVVVLFDHDISDMGLKLLYSLLAWL